jgi:hypothetical protein
MAQSGTAAEYIGRVELEAVDLDLSNQRRLYERLSKDLSPMGGRKEAQAYFNKRFQQVSEQLIQIRDSMS